MSNAATVPDEARLKALLDGALSEAEQAEVLALVEAHPHWQQALDRLAAGAQTWHAVAEHLHRPPMAADAALRSAIAAAVQPTVATDQQPIDGGMKFDFLAPCDDPRYLGRFGDYLVERVIGRGGFGMVLQAFDPQLRRVVALKVLLPHLASNAAACRRFSREARAAAAVVHDHVITIHSVGEEPLPHLVMQYVAGLSLQEKLDHCGPLEINEVLRIGMQTAAGLAAAHKHGEVHRDIKPANILLENGVERVKITDFGLARAADDASMTQSGTVAGTPQYMSPEQARGETVDFRSDLFSLGSVLYAMCAGRPPFRATTTMGVLKRVCEEPPRPIREVNPEVPDWLAAIIDKLMAKNPADRYSSAAEVADLLGQCLSYVQQPGAAPLPSVGPVCRTGPASSTASAPQVPLGKRDLLSDDAQLDHARRSVREPAIGLIITGILNWIALAIVLIFLSNFLQQNIFDDTWWLIPVIAVLGLGSGLMVIGGLKMLRLESKLLVTLAGIAAMLVGPGYFVGFPIGLWALVVLQRREVKESFAAMRRRHWPGLADAPHELPEEGEWSCRCHTCGYVAPAHKWGIVRIGAASRGKWTILLCPRCRWLSWMAVERFSAKDEQLRQRALQAQPLSATPLPRPSGVSLVLLVLFLVVAVPLTLAFAALTGYFLMGSSPPPPRFDFGRQEESRPMAQLIVECPDRQLKLALGEAPRGCGGVHVASPFEANRPFLVPLSRYCLHVKDGDVLVNQSEFDVMDEGQLVRHRVNTPGTLRIIAEPEDRGLELHLAGRPYGKSWNRPQEVSVVVPEGVIHVKMFRTVPRGGGTFILCDNYFDVRAGQETILRVWEKDVELVSAAEGEATITLHRESLKAVEERFAAGQEPVQAVIEAKLRLHQARLDWAEKAGRVAEALSIRREIIELADERVKVVEFQYASGRVTREALNEVKILLAKEQERLAEAEAKLKAPSKPADPTTPPTADEKIMRQSATPTTQTA